MTIRPTDDTTAPRRLQPLDHDALRGCGAYEFCWRPECRQEFGAYRTVERFVSSGLIIARCHRSQFTVLGMTERAA